MADQYASIKEVARKLIDKFGGPTIVRRFAEGVPPDPEKPWLVDEGTPTDFPCKAVKIDFRPDQVEGYAYQHGDKLCYIAASGIDTDKIYEEDLLLFAGDDVPWGVISASILDPNPGENLLYSLYIRQWPRRTK